jgi:hypothetical protein
VLEEENTETKRTEHNFQRKIGIREEKRHQRNLKSNTDVRYGRKRTVKTEFDIFKRKTNLTLRDIDLPILKKCGCVTGSNVISWSKVKTFKKGNVSKNRITSK